MVSNIMSLVFSLLGFTDSNFILFGDLAKECNNVPFPFMLFLLQEP
jgi:hypothetical protein